MKGQMLFLKENKRICPQFFLFYLIVFIFSSKILIILFLSSCRLIIKALRPCRQEWWKKKENQAGLKPDLGSSGPSNNFLFLYEINFMSLSSFRSLVREHQRKEERRNWFITKKKESVSWRSLSSADPGN